MRKLYILLALTMGFACSLPAQRLEEFSADRNEFTAQLGNYMTASKQKTMEDIFKEFEQSFKSGIFSDEQCQQIQTTANAMLQQRMTASPYFMVYLNALMQVNQTNNPEQTFAEWHTILNTILADIENRRLNPYLDFLNFSLSFFEKKALRASDLGTNWYALTDNYAWHYEQKQPSIRFEKLDLMAGHRQDSIFIYETGGEYFPVEQIWKGKGGKVTWERLGMGDVYAELGEYTLETNKSLYEASEAKLYHPQFFGNKLIPGKFSDKLIFGNDATSSSYPRFESNEDRLELKDIGRGIQYTGGFRLHGSTVYGYGSKENKAEVRAVSDEKKLIFRGKSELFTIRQGERIVAERVETVMRFGQDSIYHPSVNIRYDIEKNQLRLTRGERGSDRNPFFTSAHQINIDAEDILVFLDADSVLIGRKVLSSSYNPAVTFESLEYFNKGEYNRIQNIATINPLALMKVVAERENTREIDANDLAKKMNSKFTVDNIQRLLYDLVAKGFIGYDSERQIVEVKDKVFHYADAEQEKVDFDFLKIRSDADSTNAVINLQDQSIIINGVSNVEFSSKQRVGVKPIGNQVVLKKNRDMDIDGRLFAGYGVLEGKDYHFDYEKFQIALDSVRYFDLFVPSPEELDENGNPKAYSIASRIEHLSGVLLIDAPNNKSGREDIVIFPSLQTNSDAFVFYDIDSTAAKTYPRDSFYFRIEPFSFNHLDRFTAKDIGFKGELHSADIFPDFDETLRLQENDFSLGFISDTPKEGYPVYQGKGTYIGNVNLSNKGLLGEGNLKYLGASIDAKGISFRPHDLSARADQFNLEEDRKSAVQTPKVRGTDVSIDWRPYQDSMYIRSETAPFNLFQKDDHTLRGTLILTPGGLKADGTLDWDAASMASDLFAFGAFSASADTTNLRIKAIDAADIALSTNNVKGEVNFDEEIGTFKANDEFLLTTLPYNQYQTSMNEFGWDMKNELITFQSDPNKPGNFLSIHPDQDSLRFNGENASYDLKSSELKISGVPNIVTADAFIFPDSGYVEIQPGGVMRTLENARIVCDTINQNHVINRATVNILGRRFYRASGFYEYNIGGREQEIEFSDITGEPVGKGKYSEKATVTRAVGAVSSEEDFYIDHKTRFYGRISLSAETPNLTFDGFAKIDAQKLPNPLWFTVSSEGDKKDLAIKYDTPKSEEGWPLETGLYLSKESARVYASAMAPLKFRKDRPILPAKGVFKYLENKDQFVFGDSAKVLSNARRGNKFVFDDKTGKVEAEGKFNLGSGLKYISLDAAGIAKTAFPPIVENPEIVSDTASLIAPDPMQEPEMPLTAELMLGVKFQLPDQLLKILYNDITSSFDATVIPYLTDVEFYKKAAFELFPNNVEVETAITGMSSGYLDIPKKFNPYTLVFSKVKMKWESEYQSFLSTDSKIGINSINGDPIQKMLECYIECRMPTNDDDRLYIYIKTTSELVYFFGYKQGILSVTSNNPTFMDALDGLKDKDLIMKMPDGETFEIMPVEFSDARLFLRRIQAANK